MTIIALVGMPGSGKTEVTKLFREKGYEYIRFGQAVLDEVLRRFGPEGVNEKNERMVRESMREEHGMAVMAKLLIPTFDSFLNQGKKIIADGLYSWEEYMLLKEKYKEELFILAIYSKPETRYARLSDPKRKFDPKKDKNAIYRPYTPEEAKTRDHSEIEILNKAGPIAMADYTIINEGSLEELKDKIKTIIKEL